MPQRHPDRRRLQHLSRHAHHLRRLHHLDLQRELYRPRARDRPADADVPAFLSRALPGDAGRDEPGAGRQQHRAALGRPRGRDALDRDDGRHLPHAGSGRGGVEVFHPRQRRHCARVLRHHPGLSRGAGNAGRGASRDGMGSDGGERRQVRSEAAVARLRVPAGRLRHQGRPRAVPCLAAGCACRRPDADLGGAVGAAAQRRALCAAALQDDPDRQPRDARMSA